MNIREIRMTKKRRKKKREMNETLETNKKERIEEKSKYIDSCDLDVASA